MAQLKGNTLIEVLVSLALIGLIFVIGMGLITGFHGIYAPTEQVSTYEWGMMYLNLPVIEEEEVEKEEQGRIIHRKVWLYDPQSGLFKVEVMILWKGKTIQKLQRWTFSETNSW